MTSSSGAVPQDLAARLFRALYDDYDLHTIDDLPSTRTARRQSKVQRDDLARGSRGISGIRDEQPRHLGHGASRTAPCICG